MFRVSTQNLLDELGNIVSWGASLDRLALQPTLCKIAQAENGSPWQQGKLVWDFLMFEIEFSEGFISICKRHIPAEVYRPAYKMNLGLLVAEDGKTPLYVPTAERRIKAVQTLGLKYPPSTWRKKPYEGKFLEQLAWKIVEHL